MYHFSGAPSTRPRRGCGLGPYLIGLFGECDKHGLSVGWSMSPKPKIPKITNFRSAFSTGRSAPMALEIGAIERSRRVDSQAWSTFFSTRPRRKVMTSQSRVILGKSRISDGFVLEMACYRLDKCLSVKNWVWSVCAVFFSRLKFEFSNYFLETGCPYNLMCI